VLSWTIGVLEVGNLVGGCRSQLELIEIIVYKMTTVAKVMVGVQDFTT
jgi:hypothetical protein